MISSEYKVTSPARKPHTGFFAYYQYFLYRHQPFLHVPFKFTVILSGVGTKSQANNILPDSASTIKYSWIQAK